MLGTRIVMDEEKINAQKEFDLNKIYRRIDTIAKNCNLIKQDKYTYICKGDEQDLANLGIFIHNNMAGLTWFTLNVKEWIFLDDEEGNEDIKYDMKKRGEGIWG